MLTTQSSFWLSPQQGIHSKEALEMVKEHVRTLMGQATLAYDSAIVRMPKLQAVQVRPA